jgi:hypothetical protein
VAVNFIVGIGTIKAAALSPGLEGTALLASAGLSFDAKGRFWPIAALHFFGFRGA